tara:strand:- start:424 stop:651 length:228 start_codon:yes stop_codon:yes gene_type:complete
VDKVSWIDVLTLLGHFRGYSYDTPEKSLLDDIIKRNPNITTTSHDLVLIKNGMEIASAIKCIRTPNVTLTCNTTK